MEILPAKKAFPKKEDLPIMEALPIMEDLPVIEPFPPLNSHAFDCLVSEFKKDSIYSLIAEHSKSFITLKSLEVIKQ